MIIQGCPTSYSLLELSFNLAQKNIMKFKFPGTRTLATSKFPKNKTECVMAV